MGGWVTEDIESERRGVEHTGAFERGRARDSDLTGDATREERELRGKSCSAADGGGGAGRPGRMVMSLSYKSNP